MSSRAPTGKKSVKDDDASTRKAASKKPAPAASTRKAQKPTTAKKPEPAAKPSARKAEPAPVPKPTVAKKPEPSKKPAPPPVPTGRRKTVPVTVVEEEEEAPLLPPPKVTLQVKSKPEAFVAKPTAPQVAKTAVKKPTAAPAPGPKKGPPVFKPLKGVALKKEAKIAPAVAVLAEDLTAAVPVTFHGRPPAKLTAPAMLSKQEAALSGIKAREEALEGPKAADKPVVTEARPKRAVVKAEQFGVTSMFEDAAKPAVTMKKAPLPPGLDGKAVAAPPKATVAATAVAEKPLAVVEEEAPKKKVQLPPLRDAAEAAEIKPDMDELIEHVTEAVEEEPVPSVVSPPYFVPENRRSFKFFLIQTYKKYLLPPQPNDPDPEACTKSAKASNKELKTFQYQAFVRDYLQRASPYRGLLVYHGLGSGKTCTSIATAEALYGAGNRKIFVMTPASLSPNYRGEMTKCGYFAFRQENYWAFVPANVKKPSPELTFLTDTLGLPIDWIRKTKGGWVPDPSLPSNWSLLTPEEQRTINEQIQRHIAARFTFINYNGLTEQRVREWACKNPRMFDGAVIIIDEVHNLVRNINNSSLESFYKNEPLEPDYDAKYCLTGKRYRIAYLVYRMLCNAVGAKVIALSGTPIINYPQELGILSNILSGDMRYAGATLSPSVNLDVVKATLARNPEVDLFEVTPGDGVVTVRLSPVPSGYRKVVNPANGELRGFVRLEDEAATAEEIKRERDMDAWLQRVEANLKASLKSTKPIFANVQMGVTQRLPDLEKPFVETFINTDTLALNKPNDIVLIARLTGLVSYYKAGKPELVARVVKDELVEVDMSDRQLQQYSIVRNTEIKQEERDRKGKGKVKQGDARYQEIMKTQKSTFKIFSRAACNFVFPDDIPRPRPGDENKAALELGGVKSDGTDAEVIADGDRGDYEAVSRASSATTEETNTDEDPYQAALKAAIAALRKKGSTYFSSDNLKMYSPKFQAILDNLETATGPALIYSQFKTLEGLGILSLALEFQKNYIKLDVIPQANGQYALSPELLVAENINKKRYIAYTGDEPSEKRDMLKHIFNANWAKVPPALVKQIKDNFGENNIQGRIAQVFMITQSGAEGISLSNVRQVHLMEPYWNYVRLEQVKGRAIRICSHADLAFENRTVEVYTYISKFSERQIKERRVDETLMIKDGGETTDQAILSISNDKRKLADSLADAMKRAAVDCELNATENGPLACYRFEKPSNQILFHPNLDEDLRESSSSVRRK